MGSAARILVAGLVLGLAGCGPPQPQPQAPPQSPRQPQSQSPPQPQPRPQPKPQPQSEPRPKPPSLDGLDDLAAAAEEEERPVPTPRVVADDHAQQERDYRHLPALRDPPAWLTLARLVRAVGPRLDPEEKEELARQLEMAGKGEADSLALGLIDPARGLYALSFHLGHGASGLVVLDARTQGPRVAIPPRSGRPLLRDVAGDERPEIVVPAMVGDELSAFPLRWDVYALAGGMRLRRIASVAKEFSCGSRSQRYAFFNRVTFPRKDAMVVETVLHEPHRCHQDRGGGIAVPARLGERREHQYRKAAGRFVPATR